MDLMPITNGLTPSEEAFLQALLWEELNLRPGPASQAATTHGLSVLRCLEVANRLSPNLQGDALARLQAGDSPVAVWPWPTLRGPNVLRELWSRLAKVPETTLHAHR
jgi:hypothetical protein